jgi:hypothetical protein
MGRRDAVVDKALNTSRPKRKQIAEKFADSCFASCGADLQPEFAASNIGAAWDVGKICSRRIA